MNNKIDYHKGYAEGYKEGYLKALESITKCNLSLNIKADVMDKKVVEDVIRTAVNEYYSHKQVR